MANNTLAENVAQAISDFSHIKAAIAEKGVEVPQGTPTSKYADKISEISSSLWDLIQNKLEQKDGGILAFSGMPSWVFEDMPETLVIDISGAYYNLYPRTFYQASINTDTIDLQEKMGENGVIIFRGGTSISQLFYNANISKLPKIIFTGTPTGQAGATIHVFNSKQLTDIKEIQFAPNSRFDSGANLTPTFNGAVNLKHIIFTNTIVSNNINIKDCPLDKASIESIVSSLDDGASDKTCTFKLSAVNTAFETSEGAGDGSLSEEWAELMQTKSNWTISLI